MSRGSWPPNDQVKLLWPRSMGNDQLENNPFTEPLTLL